MDMPEHAVRGSYCEDAKARDKDDKACRRAEAEQRRRSDGGRGQAQDVNRGQVGDHFKQCAPPLNLVAKPAVEEEEEEREKGTVSVFGGSRMSGRRSIGESTRPAGLFRLHSRIAPSTPRVGGNITSAGVCIWGADVTSVCSCIQRCLSTSNIRSYSSTFSMNGLGFLCSPQNGQQ